MSPTYAFRYTDTALFATLHEYTVRCAAYTDYKITSRRAHDQQMDLLMLQLRAKNKINLMWSLQVLFRWSFPQTVLIVAAGLNVCLN